MLTGREFADVLIRTGFGTPETIIGCTESEVRHVEKTVGFSLPERYRDFLFAAGKCAGGYDISSDWLYPELLSLKEKAVHLLNSMESGRLSLPEKAFVCAMGTPEGFAFFEADGALETGPVFSYYEEDGHFTRVYDSFSDMLEKELLETLQKVSQRFIKNCHESALRRVRRLAAEFPLED